MRALPVPVRFYRDETVSSFFSRLCAANRISEYEAWRALRQDNPELGIAVTPPIARVAIEELGGLRRDAMPRIRRSYSTCKHDPTMWVRACTFCNGRGFGPTTLCRRCARGNLVFVERFSGPICVRHARWHSNGLDIDIRGYRPSLIAQKRLNGSLHQQSVGYRAPVATIARDIIHEWWHPAHRSTEQIGLEDEITGMPRLVETTAALTSPAFQTLITYEHTSHRAIAAVLMRIGAVARAGEDVTRFAETIRLNEPDSALHIGGETWSLTSSRSGPALEAPQQLWRRIPTVRAALLKHRNALKTS